MKHAPHLISTLMLALGVLLAGCQGSGDAGTTTSSSAEMSAADGEWTYLFDGASIEGWTKHGGAATYAIEDSAIVGTSALNSENTFLCAPQEYGDFVLAFETRVHDSLNSGVQIRSKVRQDDDRVYGPQVEIEASLEDGAEAGYIYGEATGRGWLTPDSLLTPTQIFQDGQWNQYRVRAEGPRIQTWVNGEQMADLTHEEIYENHQTGKICLQVHGIGDEGPYTVSWRDIRIREL